MNIFWNYSVLQVFQGWRGDSGVEDRVVQLVPCLISKLLIPSQNLKSFVTHPSLRWPEIVSSYHSLSIDATIMVSKTCSITGEYVGIVFVTQ